MIKKLAKSIREYKLLSILSAVFVTLEVITEVYIPFEMSKMLDYGINAGDMEYVKKSGLILLISAALVVLFGNLAGRACAAGSCGFATNLRHDMYYNIQNFSFSNIDKFSTSSLITRMTTDVQNIQNAYMMLIRGAFRSPLMVIFSSIMAFRISPKLASIFIACLPVMAVGMYMLMSRIHPIIEKVFKKYDILNRVVQENLRGVRVVKSFIREEYEKDKFEKISEEIRSGFTTAEVKMAWMGPLMMVCSYSCIILVSWLGAKAIVACGGDPVLGLSTGMLMSLITYSTQILMSIMMFSMVFIMCIIARESAHRVVEVLDEKSDLDNPDAPIYEIPDGSIEFKNVDFSYYKTDEKLALKDINIKINAGETIGIIGGTGSSKSTLVQMIPRLYDSYKGSVIVGGHDVKEYDIKTLRDSVAMVLQKNILFAGTIKENMRWGNENATDEEIAKACILAQADGFVNEMPDGYDTMIEQGGTNVSGGQKQRLCIARALLKKPKILILDDSTSAVDTATDALIRKAFAEEIPNTTKLIIAQRITSVKDADRIIVMDDGKISAVGTHEELLKSCDIYKEVYESQVKGGMTDE